MSAIATAAALNRVSALLSASLTLLAAAQRVSDTIRQAQAEGRDLTPNELANFARADDDAAAALDAAIATARAKV